MRPSQFWLKITTYSIKEKNSTIVQDFGDYKILVSAVKRPGLFAFVICGNGIGTADERKIAGRRFF